MAMLRRPFVHCRPSTISKISSETAWPIKAVKKSFKVKSLAGNMNDSIIASKHRLWILVRTASLLECVSTIYVLSKNKKNIKKKNPLKIFIF